MYVNIKNNSGLQNRNSRKKKYMKETNEKSVKKYKLET